MLSNSECLFTVQAKGILNLIVSEPSPGHNPQLRLTLLDIVIHKYQNRKKRVSTKWMKFKSVNKIKVSKSHQVAADTG